MMISMSMRWMGLKDMFINSNWNWIRMRHGYFDVFQNFDGIRFLHFNWVRLLDGVRNPFLNNLMFDCVDWHWKQTNSFIHWSIFDEFMLWFTFNRMVHRYMNWIRLRTRNKCKNTVKLQWRQETRAKSLTLAHSHRSVWPPESEMGCQPVLARKLAPVRVVCQSNVLLALYQRPTSCHLKKQDMRWPMNISTSELLISKDSKNMLKSFAPFHREFEFRLPISLFPFLQNITVFFINATNHLQ